MSGKQIGLDGQPTTATSNRCPVCGDEYAEKRRGKKITVPEEYESCKHEREYEGDVSTGIWYLHELEEPNRWFHCWGCEIEFHDGNGPVQNGTVYGRCPECGATLEKEVPRK